MSIKVNRRSYKCNIEHCKRASIDRGIILHRLPVNPGISQMWSDICKIKNKNFFVCSDHFQKDDYIPTRNWERRRLKKCAVPSIFPVAEKTKPTVDILKRIDILRKPLSQTAENVIVNTNAVYFREEDMLREVEESDDFAKNDNKNGSSEIIEIL